MPQLGQIESGLLGWCVRHSHPIVVGALRPYVRNMAPVGGVTIPHFDSVARHVAITFQTSPIPLRIIGRVGDDNPSIPSNVVLQVQFVQFNLIVARTGTIHSDAVTPFHEFLDQF